MIRMYKFKEILLLKNINGVGKVKIYKNYWEMLTQSKDLDDLVDLMDAQADFSRKILEMAREDAEETYNSIIDSDIHVITVFDEEYPEKLNVMGNKRPLILYVKGNVEALTKPNIAVIGTRKPSDLSKSFEENLVKHIVNSSERVIVSGLALGCDKIAHKATVDENKPTIAILPSGVNVITPASNKKLAEMIIETGGCLVSEYNINAKAFKGTYVERDSVVAAFSDALFVVECGVKSGTMHTVDAASNFKRDIYTYLPAERPKSFDGNEFIIENMGNAIPVDDIDEFLVDLNNLKTKNDVKSGQSTLFDY